MKIPSVLATKVASSRFKFIRELSIFLDLDVHRSLCMILKDYQNNPLILEGVIIPPSINSISETKIYLIASGKFQCRAYLAQICLDYLLKAGYIPQSAEDKKLVALMFLTRFTVKHLDDAIKLIPHDWPQDISDEFVLVMREIINE